MYLLQHPAIKGEHLALLTKQTASSVSGAAETGVDSWDPAREKRITLYIPKCGSAEEVQSGMADQ